MRRWWLLAGGLLAVLLLLYAAVEALQVPLLVDPSPWLRRGGPWAAALGVGLLWADVVIPVPSSLVMVAHCELFGPVLGALLSVLGGVGATLIGFALGRWGSPLVSRILSPAERQRADQLLARWGALAVLVTRPLPLLAETVAMLAGASVLPWPTVAVAALAGYVPVAVLYALAGARAATFANATLAFLLVVAMAGLFWWVGRRLERRARPPETVGKPHQD